MLVLVQETRTSRYRQTDYVKTGPSYCFILTWLYIFLQIFDKFLPRLQDPNSKVNLYALQVMLQIIPILNNSLAAVINIAVGNVSPNLSSKNKEINQAAIDIIDALLENMGNFKCFKLV